MPCQRHFPLQCDYVGRFLLRRNFQQRMYFSLSRPDVAESFALGFLVKLSDRYPTVAARRDVKAVWK